MEANIDSQSVSNLNHYRAQPSLFRLSLPLENFLGLPPGDTEAVSDGVWILILPPRKSREHIIHVNARERNPDFQTEVLYNLAVPEVADRD